jgi:hypothetical protein
MARSTPAQKPRGAASSKARAGLSMVGSLARIPVNLVSSGAIP